MLTPVMELHATVKVGRYEVRTARLGKELGPTDEHGTACFFFRCSALTSALWRRVCTPSRRARCAERRKISGAWPRNKLRMGRGKNLSLGLRDGSRRPPALLAACGHLLSLEERKISNGFWNDMSILVNSKDKCRFILQSRRIGLRTHPSCASACRTVHYLRKSARRGGPALKWG